VISRAAARASGDAVRPGGVRRADGDPNVNRPGPVAYSMKAAGVRPEEGLGAAATDGRTRRNEHGGGSFGSAGLKWGTNGLCGQHYPDRHAHLSIERARGDERVYHRKMKRMGARPGLAFAGKRARGRTVEGRVASGCIARRRTGQSDQRAAAHGAA